MLDELCLRHSHTAPTSERALLIASLAQRMCAIAETVPASAFGHGLAKVVASRRAPTPGSYALPSHQHIPSPLFSTAVPSSSLLDLSPLSPHLHHVPLSHFTRFRCPDLPRDVATPIALAAADILSHLPTHSRLSLSALIDDVNTDARHPLHHLASRLIHHLPSAYPTRALRLPLAWGSHATTMESRLHSTFTYRYSVLASDGDATGLVTPHTVVQQYPGTNFFQRAPL